MTAAPRPRAADDRAEAIAIVGMAALFPQSPDKESFWRNILERRDCVTEAPEDWHAELFLDPDSAENDRVYTSRGGFLGDLARFDPLRHGVMPSSVDGGEPDQFLALDLAADTLEDAGFGARPVPGERVAVILGRGTYINRGFASVLQHGIMIDRFLAILKQLHPDAEAGELADIKRRLKASLPPFNAEVAPALVPNLVSGRISNRLDFRGANYIIDAACASSLIALERGVADLRGGRCDMALVGGVHASTPAPIYQIFCQLEALSRKGRIRPFSAEADGTLLAEGVGILCLKRLRDAEAAGERIYALVRGVGVASDGKGAGILAPRIEGERLALERAYDEAGIDPATVGLIEAHGTATSVGDATEIEALADLFGGSGKTRRDCALGTVKSNIGHCLPASGAAGLIKTALALHHRVLPPMLLDSPNPALGIENTPLYLNTEARPWVHGARTPRRAGVNAFGFGGINAHAVLEEYRGGAEPEPVLHRESEMLALDAADAQALAARLKALDETLAGGQSWPEIAARTNATLGTGRWRAAIVAADAPEARARLGRIAEALARGKRRLNDRRGAYLGADPLGPGGKIAFMFPGEGSQHRGMLRELMLYYPAMRRWFDLVDGAFAGTGRDLLPSQAVFPPDAPEQGDDSLWRMDIGAEAIFAANQAVAELYRRLGLGCDMVVGHSTGEYSALYAAGVTRRDDPARLRREIRELHDTYQTLSREGAVLSGKLVAVGAVEEGALDAALGPREDLSLAMDNCPNQKVFAALSEEAAEALEAAVARLGGFSERLPFERAYHSPAFAGFSEGLAGYMRDLAFAAPEVPVYSCLIAAPFPDDAEGIRALTVGQWAGRVRFTETIRRMHDDGARIFIECGPRNTLTAFVGDILRGQEHLALAVDTPGRGGLLQLHHFAARLAVEAVPFDPAAIAAPRAGREEGAGRRRGQPLKMGLQPMQLDAPPPRRRPEAARPEPPRQPRAAPENPAARSPAAPAQPAAAGTVQPAAGGAVLDAYFETMSAFMRTETEIMQAYLRQPVAGRAPAPVKAAAREGRFPLLAAVARDPGGSRLSARIRFDTDSAPFLKDHCLGHGLSRRDPGLLGACVVPLTFSMEALAEAAAALRPDLVVTAMRELRASRWLVVEPGGLELEAVAEARDAGTGAEITVRLREAGGAALRPVLAEAVVEMAAARAPAPAMPERPRAPAAGAPWTQEEIYRRIMFHGPSLRAVESMDHAAEAEVEGVLVGLPAAGLLAGLDAPQFELDPVTLDAVGQLVGVWAAEMLEQTFHVFPFRAERLEVFRPPLAEGERARCRCRIARPAGDELRSDIEVVSGDGRLQCRLEGWWDKRFDLPERFFAARLDPAGAFMSRPLDPGPGMGEGLCLRLIDDLPDALLEGSGGIWGRVLAGLALSASERVVWAEMATAKPARRWDWLRGRVAAKDALRALAARGELPADIEIEAADAEGAPRPAGAWAVACDTAPHLSISHSGGMALGAAADPALYDGVGVDLERVVRRDAGFIATAFTAAEQAALLAIPEGEARDLAVTRLWCAKEAAAKSFHRGLEAFDRFEADPAKAGGEGLVLHDRSTQRDFAVAFSSGVEAGWVVAVVLRLKEGS